VGYNVNLAEFLNQESHRIGRAVHEKGQAFYLHKCEKGKEQESGQNEKVLSLIQHKIDEQDKVLKEIK